MRLVFLGVVWSTTRMTVGKTGLRLEVSIGRPRLIWRWHGYTPSLTFPVHGFYGRSHILLAFNAIMLFDCSDHRNPMLLHKSIRIFLEPLEHDINSVDTLTLPRYTIR